MVNPAPGSTPNFAFYFDDNGVQTTCLLDSAGNIIDIGVEKRIIEKSGAWFAYGGERLGQGRENAKQFLKDNPDIAKTIEDRVRRELGMTRDAAEIAAV